MNPTDIQPDRYYRTHSGTICKVTAIDEADEKIISFIPYNDRKAGEAEQMPAVLFSANVEEEVQAEYGGQRLDGSPEADRR